MITFEPLWKTMKKRGVTGYALINKHGVSRSLWFKLRHDENINLDTLNRLCEILDCEVEDIIKRIPNKSEQG